MHDYRWGVDVKRLNKIINVLLVEDNTADIKLFEDTLKHRIGKDLFVYDARSIDEANDIITRSDIDIIYLDLNLPDAGNTEGFNRLKENHENIPVIILSGSKDEKLARHLVRMGAQDYIFKEAYTESQIMKPLLFAMSRNELLLQMKNIRRNLLHLIDNIEPTVFVINGDNRILYVDHSAEKTLGKSAAELVGKEFPLEFNLEEKVITSLEKYGVPGKLVQINAYKSIWGNNEAFVLTVQDITAKQISAEKLKRLESIRSASRDINHLIVRSGESEELIFSTLRILYDSKLFNSIHICLNEKGDKSPGKAFAVSDDGDVKKLSEQNAKKFSKYYSEKADSKKLLEFTENSSDSDEKTYVKILRCNNESFGYISAKLRKDALLEKEEKELLVEIADDLAFAFNNFNVRRELISNAEKNKALVSSENKFRELSDNLPVTIAIIKGDKLLYTNKEASRLTGYRLNELYSLDILNFISAEKSDKIRKMLKSDVNKNKTTREFEVEIKTKTNISKWVDITAVEINYEGESAILITALDVSARKRAEDEIRKLSQAVHQSPIGVIITDSKGIIEYVNSYFTVITGYSAVDVLGKNPRILQSGLTEKSVYKNMWETILSGKTWNGEFINKNKKGEEYIIKSTISPIKDRKGKITHYVALEEDITELKKMIQDLVVAREEAEKADRLKSEFIAQISHEIRTPLTPIMSYSGFLRNEFSDGADGTMNMIFDSIERSSKRLIRTVDLLIHFSELNVGSYDKNKNKTDIRKEIFEPCYYEYCTLAKRKNLDFQFKLDEDIEITTNTSALYEILMNLLDNAVKYTEEGSILLAGLRKKNKFIIKVSDTGIGIAEEYLPKIFEPFSQEDAGYTRRFDGTGLGMALVKKYCDLNDIELSVESVKGKGTTFALKFDISEEHK